MSSLDDVVEEVFGFLENNVQLVENATISAASNSVPMAPIVQEYHQDFLDFHHDFSTRNPVDRSYNFHERQLFWMYDNLSPYRFHETFRMNKDTFDYLYDELSEVIPEGRSNNQKNILGEEKLLCFLRAVGGDEFNFFNAQAVHVSEGSAFNAMNQVIDSCFAPDVSKNGISFVKRQIRLPDEQSARLSGLEFLSKAAFPATWPPIIIGAIDGTHINVIPPKADQLRFRNRHGGLSINATMMCDAFGTINYVSSSGPGSYHDQTILQKTKIYEKYELRNQLPFEEALVLGDSAYKRSMNWLLTPFLEGLVVDDEKRALFNKSVCGCRSIIEDVYGMLKRKFPVLKGTLRSPDMVKCSRMIKVLAAFFNFIKFHEPYDLFWQYPSDEQLALYSEDFVYVDHTETVTTTEKYFQKYFS